MKCTCLLAACKLHDPNGIAKLVSRFCHKTLIGRHGTSFAIDAIKYTHKIDVKFMNNSHRTIIWRIAWQSKRKWNYCQCSEWCGIIVSCTHTRAIRNMWILKISVNSIWNIDSIFQHSLALKIQINLSVKSLKWYSMENSLIRNITFDWVFIRSNNAAVWKKTSYQHPPFHF